MTQSTIETGFYVSLFVLMPIGLLLMVLWAVKVVYRPLVRHTEQGKHIDLTAVAMRTFVYMLPGLLAFVLFSIPVLYFSNLQKQTTYCREVVDVNHMKQSDAADLPKSCRALDVDELFQARSAASGP